MLSRTARFFSPEILSSDASLCDMPRPECLMQKLRYLKQLCYLGCSALEPTTAGGLHTAVIRGGSSKKWRGAHAHKTFRDPTTFSQAPNFRDELCLECFWMPMIKGTQHDPLPKCAFVYYGSWEHNINTQPTMYHSSVHSAERRVEQTGVVKQIYNTIYYYIFNRYKKIVNKSVGRV